MPDKPVVTIDTSPWIALLAKEVDRAEHVLRLLEQAERGEIKVFVSTVTITETVKGPAAGDPLLTDEQESVLVDYMDNPFITLVSVDPVVAARARDLRRHVRWLKTPDAMILATALVTGSETLYTYDQTDLVRLNGSADVGGLRIVIPPVDYQLAFLAPTDAPPRLT
ncbi:MAG: PIN domain-containing protein [Chloroflexi bacterium]|nr:PIN domain-containing protein [Chloroflexota bacterium]